MCMYEYGCPYMYGFTIYNVCMYIRISINVCLCMYVYVCKNFMYECKYVWMYGCMDVWM